MKWTPARARKWFPWNSAKCPYRLVQGCRHIGEVAIALGCQSFQGNVVQSLGGRQRGILGAPQGGEDVAAKGFASAVTDPLRSPPSATRRLFGSFLQKLHYGFRPVVDAQLLKDVSYVFVDGIDADAKPLGDFLVQLAFAEQGQHLMFALGQVGQLGRRAADGQGSNRALEVLPHSDSQFLVREVLPCQHFGDRFEEPGGRGAP